MLMHGYAYIVKRNKMLRVLSISCTWNNLKFEPLHHVRILYYKKFGKTVPMMIARRVLPLAEKSNFMQ